MDKEKRFDRQKNYQAPVLDIKVATLATLCNFIAWQYMYFHDTFH